MCHSLQVGLRGSLCLHVRRRFHRVVRNNGEQQQMGAVRGGRPGLLPVGELYPRSHPVSCFGAHHAFGMLHDISFCVDYYQRLPTLVVDDVDPSTLPPYDRAEWPHWTTINCQTTRTRVLIEVPYIQHSHRDDSIPLTFVVLTLFLHIHTLTPSCFLADTSTFAIIT